MKRIQIKGEQYLHFLDTTETELYTVLPRGKTVLSKTVRPRGKTVYDSVSTTMYNFTRQQLLAWGKRKSETSKIYIKWTKEVVGPGWESRSSILTDHAAVTMGVDLLSECQSYLHHKNLKKHTILPINHGKQGTDTFDKSSKFIANENKHKSRSYLPPSPFQK